MQKTRFNRLLSLIVCMVLIAAMALFTSGCSNNTENAGTPAPEASAAQTDGNVLGQGEKQFTFIVVDGDGAETSFTINTDKPTVGEALVELELIAGDQDQYGLYVRTVNGITVDYDTDGKYWAFYVDGEYAISGVDTTEITDGAVYSFKVE